MAVDGVGTPPLRQFVDQVQAAPGQVVAPGVTHHRLAVTFVAHCDAYHSGVAGPLAHGDLDRARAVQNGVGHQLTHEQLKPLDAGAVDTPLAQHPGDERARRAMAATRRVLARLDA